MKKRVFLLTIASVLIVIALAACAGNAVGTPVQQPEPTPVETPSVQIPEKEYTVEQIQDALNGFVVGPGGENCRVTAVKKVEMDRDSITMGEVEQKVTFDLSQATRYEVTYEVRFNSDLLYRTSIDVETGEELEYRQWNGDDYRNEGDDVIFTHIEYYYFNDENGNPVLAAWYC